MQCVNGSFAAPIRRRSRVLDLDRVHDLIYLFGWETLGLALPFAVGVGAASIAAYLVQTGALWASDGLTVDGSKISPIAGMARLFSFRSTGELIKAILKLSVIAGERSSRCGGM